MAKKTTDEAEDLPDLTPVRGATADEHDELLARLQDLVPAAFPDNRLDPQALLDALEARPDGEPPFAFTWPGINDARGQARMPTTATLVPDPEASVNWDTARDVLIEGDNLQVLKLLKAGYAGQTKLIYIDPPYNTGETFTYNDDYAAPESEYLAATGQVDEQGNVLTSKAETAGRKHAPWLTMMFPRVAAGRHLLRRDGVILVSIDDNEVHHLRLLLDATFGAANFIGTFVWNGGRKNDARRMSSGHDYIVAYARDYAHLKDQDIRWRERKTGLDEIYAKVAELRDEHGEDYEAATSALNDWYKTLDDGHPSKAHAHYKVIDARGVFFPSDLRSPNPRPNLVFTFRGYEPHANGWAYALERMEAFANDDRIVYPEKKDGRLQLKSYLHEHEYWAPASVFYRDRRAASKALKTLMGAEVFDYPKDVDVLGRLVEAITEEGDLVVDFFAGSGSTGHAVWQQSLRDGQHRRWLLVQVPESPDESGEFGANAIGEGYETIFEVAAERLRRAAKAVGGDLGFRVFRARPTNLIIEPPIVVSEDMTGDEYVQATLRGAEAPPVADGADPAAVAWEIVLKATGTQLDAHLVEHDGAGVTVWEFKPPETQEDAGRLFVCLGEFTIDAADALGLEDKDTLILRSDRVDDSTTLTLAPRLKSNLLMLERVPRDVSL